MNIKCLAIYGSTARGDRSSKSDVDCFAIYDESHYKMIVKGSVNIALYPIPLAKKIMKEGSIFALHIKEEATPIFNDGLFNEIISLFEYKDNYNHEIDTASKLLKFISSKSRSIKNKLLMNKRISWCVRTILISMCASERIPIFSKEKLAAKFSNNMISYDEISYLISLKLSHHSERYDLELVENFLSIYGNDSFNENNDKFLKKSIARLLNGDTGLEY